MLSDIVNVQISRETVSVSRAGFSTILILGPNCNFNARTQAIADLASAALVLTGGASSPEYKAIQAAFSQSPRVPSIKLGNQKSNKIITDNAGTYTAGSMSLKVNGTTITQTYSSTKDGTLTALAAQIAAHAAVDTAVYDNTGHTITITPNAGYLVSVTSIDLSGITGTMATVLSSATSTESITDCLNAIKLYDNDWYGLIIESRAEADILLGAAWAESNEKIFAWALADSEVVDSTYAGDTGSVAKQVKDLGYARTISIYDPLAATTYPDAALLGKLFPLDPGSYTAKFKTLSGVAVAPLTPTQETNARSKNCNTYLLIGGINMFQEGVVAEGEYIDVIIFIDWLDAEMTADVFQFLASRPKVPYTSAGIKGVESIMQKRLQIGMDRGGISPLEYDTTEKTRQIGGFYTSVPNLGSVSTADKTSRTLNDVKFTAFLAGAIHAINIEGIVTV
jgi:hypothetical protein